MSRRTDRRRATGRAGYSLLEMLMVIFLLFAFLLAALAITNQLRRRGAREGSRAALRQDGREILDQLTAMIGEAGAGLAGSGRIFVYAAPWEVSFFSDSDRDATPALQALPPDWCLPLALPDSVCSAGCGGSPSFQYFCGLEDADMRYRTPEAWDSRAEVLRLTIDTATAGAAFAVGPEDKGPEAHVTAANSPNPSDYALVLSRSGCLADYLDPSQCGILATPQLLGRLRAWTDEADSYPDGSLPAPLFQYWVSESRLEEALLRRGVPAAVAAVLADVVPDEGVSMSRCDLRDGDRDDVFLFGDDGALSDEDRADGWLSTEEVRALMVDDGRGSLGAFAGQKGIDCRLEALETLPSYDPAIIHEAIVALRIQVTVETRDRVRDWVDPRYSLVGNADREYRYGVLTLSRTVNVPLAGARP